MRQGDCSMTEERIIRTDNPDGTSSTTHTTVISDRESGGAGKWVFFLLLAVALLIGAYFLMQASGAEIAKDNAVGNAAEQVGDAAGQVGEAAQEAGEAVSDAADKVDPAQ
jgi:hypothetical protein